jgi:hypothetical protein
MRRFLSTPAFSWTVAWIDGHARVVDGLVHHAEGSVWGVHWKLYTAWAQFSRRRIDFVDRDDLAGLGSVRRSL